MNTEEVYQRYLNGETDFKKLGKEYGVTQERIRQAIVKQERIVNPLNQIVALLERNYNLALRNPIVEKPISWALYQTWKEFDRKEKARKENE